MLFHKPPTIDCNVIPMPNDGPIGFYNPPSEDGSRPGIFQVNLTNPSQIPRFGMKVLSLHEVSPGHHLQACYARQLPIPTFRKKIDYRNIYSAPIRPRSGSESDPKILNHRRFGTESDPNSDLYCSECSISIPLC